ncbi:Heterokaryon incompatibility protein 6, OR allele 4 [Paraphaeosphaeria sporulosa]
MGMGPKAMREGDLFVIFGGGTVPFVIRPCDGDGYRIIGSCYIEGVMGGKLVEELHYFDDLREMVEMFKIV